MSCAWKLASDDSGTAAFVWGDTIGIARPPDVARVLTPVLARVPAGRVALHFHDTRGQALANVAADDAAYAAVRAAYLGNAA